MASIIPSKKSKQSIEHDDDCIHDDIISNLHQSILLCILSFLDIKSVVRSSILSRSWRYLWNSVPSLYFSNPYVSPRNKKKKKHRSSRDFMDVVDKVLLLRDKSLDVLKFHVESYYQCSSDRINTWIMYAAMHHVQELRLHVCLKYPRELELPRYLFTYQTLRILQVMHHGSSPYKYIRLRRPISFSLIKLQVLHLEDLKLHGEWIVEFLVNCSSLQTLVIKHCYIENINKLHISSIHLKNLVISRKHDGVDLISLHGPIKICTPNLISLTLIDYTKTTYSVENLTSLVKTDIDIKGRKLELQKELNAKRLMVFLKRVCNVNHLVLHIGLLEVLECIPARLCNLRSLELSVSSYRSCIPVILQLLKSSPWTETLIMKQRSKSDHERLKTRKTGESVTSTRPESESELQLGGALQHLKTVEMKNFQASDDELMVLKILLERALTLKNIFITASEGCLCIVKEWMKKKEIQKISQVSPSILVSVFHPRKSVEISNFYILRK